MNLARKAARALAAALITFASPAFAYVVDSVADTGAGTLREAITLANSTCIGGPYTISFNFPAAGSVVLSPGSALPPITCAGTVIDGYSHPGAVANANAIGYNTADLRVVLNGAACGGCSGLTVTANNVRIKGLVIHSFANNGIYIGSGAGVKIDGNWVGTDQGGFSATLGNGIGGVAGPANGVIVGGSTPAERNLITGNQAYQVSLGANSQVIGNQLGGARDGGPSLVSMGSGYYTTVGNNVALQDNVILANNSYGVVASGSTYLVMQGNLISQNFPGGVLFGYCCSAATGNTVFNNSGPGFVLQNFGNYDLIGNQIYGNSGDGVLVESGNNYLVGNLAYGNGGAGIRVASGNGTEMRQHAGIYGNAAAGVVLGTGAASPPNDEAAVPYDTDSGPNNLRNTPVITSVVQSAGNTIISGTVKSDPPNAYGMLDFYANPAMPAQLEGRTFFASQPVMLDANGFAAFSYTHAGLVDFVTATLTIDDCFDGCDESSGFSLAVAAGAAAGPVLQSAPAFLLFPAQLVGTTSGSQSISVTNLGPGPVTVTDWLVAGEFQVTHDCNSVMAVGATCDMDIEFSPLGAGTRSGSVTFLSNAANDPFVVPLSGIGMAAARPAIAIDPVELEFGAVRVGETSEPRAVRVTNTGGATLRFGYSVSSPEFEVIEMPPPSMAPKAMPRGKPGKRLATTGAATTCFGSLEPSEFCEIVLEFKPAAAGRRTGAIIFATDAENIAPNVQLSGFGGSDSNVRTLTVPGTLELGDQVLGTEGAGVVLRIVNASGATVVLQEVLLDSTDFKVGDGCTVIEAGATCERRVFFRPTALGARAARIVIRIATETDPYVVELTGRGIPNPVPQLGVSPRLIGFGSVITPVGTTVRLTNDGQLPVRLDLIAPLGAFMSVSHCGAVIEVGGSCTVDVTFFPSPGPHVGNLVITSNAAGSPHRVELSATGCRFPSVFNRTRSLLCN